MTLSRNMGTWMSSMEVLGNAMTKNWSSSRFVTSLVTFLTTGPPKTRLGTNNRTDPRTRSGLKHMCLVHVVMVKTQLKLDRCDSFANQICLERNDCCWGHTPSSNSFFCLLFPHTLLLSLLCTRLRGFAADTKAFCEKNFPMTLIGARSAVVSNLTDEWWGCANGMLPCQVLLLCLSNPFNTCKHANNIPLLRAFSNELAKTTQEASIGQQCDYGALLLHNCHQQVSEVAQ